MTISARERLANVELAMLKLMDGLGEQWIGGILFDVLDPGLQDILPTTWAYLQRKWWVTESCSTMGGHGGHVRYHLTGQGWIEGLRLTGKLDSAELRDRIVQLRARLKDQVKGRAADADVFLPEFCQGTGILEGWLWNVVESKLLDHFFPSDIVDVDWWDHNSRLQLLRVPVDFGMTRMER
jgi:hypothetical protein